MPANKESELKRELHEADDLIGVMYDHICRQRNILAGLERDGHTTIVVRNRDILFALEESMRLHIGNCAQIKQKLAELVSPMLAIEQKKEIDSDHEKAMLKLYREK